MAHKNAGGVKQSRVPYFNPKADEPLAPGMYITQLFTQLWLLVFSKNRCGLCAAVGLSAF
jgi:hypothetical protein